MEMVRIHGNFSKSTADRLVTHIGKNALEAAANRQFTSKEIILSICTGGIYALYKACKSAAKLNYTPAKAGGFSFNGLKVRVRVA